ncbi:transposase [Deinococcus sp. SM5_A1]|uniref:transposase n=1 Tax=Deinococcus sp. SM5_A1 TaxID=3379094 RepID=UPI00385BB240
MARIPCYPRDLSDVEWAVVGPHVPAHRPGGRPASHRRRDILDAIFYIKRGGASWQMLPIDFPHWKTVYDSFRTWKHDGVFERINDALRVQVRAARGRNAVPTAGIVDSRSVKTSQEGGTVATTAAQRSTGKNTT